MKALSVRQPWAWLIIHGGKDIENRSWPTNFRGRLLIHAAKGCTGAEFNRAWDWVLCNVSPDTAIKIPSFSKLERGGIVGEVELAGCVQRSDSCWFEGPFGFVLRNPRPLPFMPCRGSLSFFDVDAPC